MRDKHVYLGACCALLLLSACKRPERVDANRANPKPTPAMAPVAAAAPSPVAAGEFNPCSLIPTEEMQEIHGVKFIETTSTVVPNEGLQTAQCFYAAEEYAQSVAVAITRKDPKNPGERTARDLWNEMQRRATGMFPQIADRRRAAPEKVEGLGDEACFVRPSSLYVLKGDVFLHISISGTDPAEKKVEKAKAIANKALERL